ncbi:MAG: MCE family protein [alpha proteobacterium HIMB59]|nr:MAG: MCE family protein [alpha proteobacterium HIMB59]
MNRNINFEFILGITILLLCVFSFIYISSKVDLFKNTEDEFVLESSFFDIGALSIGGDVKIRGVKVGEVSKISLDQNTYLASVITSYYNEIQIPKDSIFKIAESGFIGSPYIEIILGTSNEYFLDNDSTDDNVDAVSLEEIINNFIFN